MPLLSLTVNSFGEQREIEEKIDPVIGYNEAFVFGLVEGVTEFLPISSTGHLILTNEWMLNPSSLQEDEKNAVNAYLIVIQAGAIVAVALLYSRRIIAILLGFLGLDPVGRKLGINILLAFAPAVGLGPLLDESIESLLFGAVPVSLALIGGALLMHWVEKRKRVQDGLGGDVGKKLEDLNWKNALMIGVLQCVAMCPGTSRSMMTIVGGYFAGLSRRNAAEFSFLLGLVTLTAAAGYKALTMGGELLDNLNVGPMLFGCLIAGLSAALSVRWLVGYLSRSGLGLFVWYRVVLGVVILVYSLAL
ncbi:MAG: undecaprenyl-diphosphate phosphatase [Opitutae bacterium]